MKLAITFHRGSSNGGIGFLSGLFLIFLTLKLCKIITWSWWWVFAPLWLIPALFLAIILFGLIVTILATIFSKS